MFSGVKYRADYIYKCYVFRSVGFWLKASLAIRNTLTTNSMSGIDPQQPLDSARSNEYSVLTVAGRRDANIYPFQSIRERE